MRLKMEINRSCYSSTSRSQSSVGAVPIDSSQLETHENSYVSSGTLDIFYAPITEMLQFMSKPLDYLSHREVSFASFRQSRRYCNSIESSRIPCSVVSSTGTDLESDASRSIQKGPVDSTVDTPNLFMPRLCNSPDYIQAPHVSYDLTDARGKFVSAVKSNRLADVQRAVLHSQVMIDDLRPVVYASMKGFDGIVSYLYGLGDSLTVDEFHCVARYGVNPSIMNTLLKHTDVNVKNELGGCALFFALVNHNYKMADYLLVNAPGIEMNPVDTDGFTMTRSFLYLGDFSVVSWLISRGYKFDHLRDRPIETITLGMHPSVDLVKLLIDNSDKESAKLEAQKMLKKLDSHELLTNPTIRDIFRLLKRYSYK